ncbi:hypothetical protein [Celerinatantimonas sp. MCCC 1A17872]|uniref:hypothetical protein n=1 Tax=Celerinatantimonas sp. MCCC 1A17872 TaxID=3177514 RepID=UPI0038C42A89
MSSDTFFRSPSEFVQVVLDTLNTQLGLTIHSTYRREATQLDAPLVSYLIGEIETLNEMSNDGRKQHHLELRFLVEVPTSLPTFDLEALDLSSRLQRELLLQRFGCSEDVKDSRLVSNLPSQFDPHHGVLARTVTMRQTVLIGPIEEDWLLLEEVDGYVGNASEPSIVIRADSAPPAAGD